MTAPFDFAPLLAPGTPAPAIKWNGFPKYNFIGGHNDAKQVPVDALIAAATAVLKREGAIARDLRTEQRSARLPAAARVPRRQAQGPCRHRLLARRDPDHRGLRCRASTW